MDLDLPAVMAVMISLFTLNYLALGAIWKQLNKYANALKIICREHAENHGLKEIDL
jgi:hypothetical protein